MEDEKIKSSGSESESEEEISGDIIDKEEVIDETGESSGSASESEDEISGVISNEEVVNKPGLGGNIEGIRIRTG